MDLRDAELDRLGLERTSLVATTAEHYPCTRRVAASLHGTSVGGVLPQGLVWHSRQAELAVAAPAEVAVVLVDRATAGGGSCRWLVRASARCSRGWAQSSSTA